MRGNANTELNKLNIDTGNYVCQSNELIMLNQSLSLNALKLIRAAMMQIVRSDTELEAYYINVTDMASLLNTSRSNLYRDMDKIINDIAENPITIMHPNGKRTKIPWISLCEYKPDVGVMIRLNPLLMPYLLNLRETYTQYQYETIMAMKSVYAIRIYEIIMSKIRMKVLPRQGIHITVGINELREALDLMEKYPRFSNFSQKVIIPAITEINECTLYQIEFSKIKKGGSTDAVRFKINMQYHTPHTTKEERKNEKNYKVWYSDISTISITDQHCQYCCY